MQKGTRWTPSVEVLAYELKSLIGYGAKKHHVISRPVLRDLVATEYPVEVKPHILAQGIVESLLQATKLLPEPQGEVCRCLLSLTKRWDRDTATARRTFAIVQLNLGISVETFRRPEGPELDLMRELSEVLMAAEPTEQTA